MSAFNKGGEMCLRTRRARELFLNNDFVMSFLLTGFINKIPIKTRYFKITSFRVTVNEDQTALGYLKTSYQLDLSVRRLVVFSDVKPRMYF